jgi:hypothetical protein
MTDKPIGWLRIIGHNAYFSTEEPVGKIGIRVPLAAYKEPIPKSVDRETQSDPQQTYEQSPATTIVHL